MKNDEKYFSMPEKVMDKLLDNCTVKEIEDFYKFYQSVMLQTVNWYCLRKDNRISIKKYVLNKLLMKIYYEFEENDRSRLL
jgi:hypothetical protein